MKRFFKRKTNFPARGHAVWVCCLCVMLNTSLIAATISVAQTVTLRKANVELKEVFAELKEQTGYYFMFNSDEVDVSTRTSVEANNDDLVEVLDDVFETLPLDYKVKDDYILVTKEESPEPQQQVAEELIVRGRVVDQHGEPVLGATIKFTNYMSGTISDEDGLFKFKVRSASGQMVVSFVGYKTVELTYNTKQPLDITLYEEVSKIDEVQIVAYGETNRKVSTGSMSSIKAKELEDIPSPSVGNLLQGRVAGMDVSNSSGAPGGGGTQITIRGYNSLGIEAGRRFSNPLWVIDGVPMTSFTSPVTGTNGLSDINPEMIESISVLKDASATSLYGSRAANGVILVTTKKGKKGQPGKFSVNTSYSYNLLPEYPTVYGGKGERDYRIKSRQNYQKAYYDWENNTYVYPESYTDAYGTTGIYDKYWGNGQVWEPEDGDELQDSLNNFYNNSTNFFKELYVPGKTFNANIQTYGGSELMNYSIGVGYYNEEGIVIGTGFNRVNLMGNFSATPTDKITVSLNNYISMSDRSRGVRGSSFGSGQDVELVPGEAYRLSTLLPNRTGATESAVASFQSQQEKNTSYRLRTSFRVEYELLKDLLLSNTSSIDYSQNNRNAWLPGSMDASNYGESRSIGEIGRNMMFLNESLLTYKKTVNKNHNIDFMAGLSFQNDEANYLAGSAKGGPSDMIHYVGEKGWPSLIDRGWGYEALQSFTSDYSQKKMNSYFGRLNYNYKERYLLSATLRRDGSSVFGENQKWATFPSYAAAWNFTEEEFVNWSHFMDFGKVRASYGKSGNTFMNPYLSYGLLEGGYTHEGKAVVTPVYKDGYYNPNLSWEETEQFDVGIDLSLFNYKLNVTADYYSRYTHDMLYKVPLEGDYSGYANVWSNAAAISNDGVELEVKYNIIQTQDFYWNASINIAKNWNKLASSWNNKDFYDSNERKVYVLGKKLNGIMGMRTDGYIQTSDDIIPFYNSMGEIDHNKPSDWGSGTYYTYGNTKFVDSNGDHVLDYSDEVYLGSSLPDMYGGIVNEVKWKNFDLNMLFSYSLGRDMINGLRVSGYQAYENLAPILTDVSSDTFWENPGDNSDYAKASYVSYNGDFNPYQDRFVEHVNYVKLKTLTLGYTLPDFKKDIFDSVRIFFSGENLFTITNYSGLDPETVSMQSGIDMARNYPLARKLTFGVSIKL